MSTRLVALLAALAALALIGAGCGSSGGSTESTSSMSKAEFVKQGNAICAKGSEEIEAGFEEFAKEHHLSKNKEPPKAALEEAVETIVIPKVRKQVEGIRALGVPSGDKGEVDEILTAAEEALEKGEKNHELFLEEESSGPFAKANKLSHEYGLDKCGE